MTWLRRVREHLWVAWSASLSIPAKARVLQAAQARQVAQRLAWERREQARRAAIERQEAEWGLARQIVAGGMAVPHVEHSPWLSLEAWGCSTVLDDGSRERGGQA